MSLATPTLTLVFAVTKWDVRVTVKISIAGVSRPAEAGEVEVRIRDTGEGLDYTVYHQTPYVKTNGNGQVRFNNSSYSWLVGFDGMFGANRMYIDARLVADPTVAAEKHMLLGRTTWKNPNGYGEDANRYAQAYVDRSW